MNPARIWVHTCIAGLLVMLMTSIVPSATVAHPGHSVVLGPGDGEVLGKRPGGRIDIIKVSPLSGSENVSATYTWTPAGSSVPVHRHDRMDEILYFPSGSGIGYLGDEQVTLGPGSMIYVPKGVWHGFENPKVALEIFALVSPPGLEANFREAFGSYRRPLQRPLSNEEKAENSRKYGDTYTTWGGLPESQWQTKVPSGPGFAMSREEGEATTDPTGRRITLKRPYESISGLGMAAIDLPAGANLPPSRLESAERILYIESGEGVSVCGDFRFEIESGSVVYVPPGVEHGIDNPNQAMRVAVFSTPPTREGDLAVASDSVRPRTSESNAKAPTSVATATRW